MLRTLLVIAILALVGACAHLGAAPSTSTLERIKQEKTIRIGFRENEPPMSSVGSQGEPVGYSIDLCLRVVNEVRRRLENPQIGIEYVPVTASTRFAALVDGSVDLLCGSTTVTLGRRELVDFSQLTFVTGASLLSLDAAAIGEIGDLQGKKVAVVKDTTTLEALKKALAEAVVEAEIVPVETASAGIEALVNNRVSAFSSDQVVLIGLVLRHEDPSLFAISKDLFSFEPFALALRRNEADFRLLVDRVLSQLYRSGQIGSIYARWFGRFSKEVPTLVEAMYILNATPE